jgi:hypothetical protein
VRFQLKLNAPSKVPLYNILTAVLLNFAFVIYFSSAALGQVSCGQLVKKDAMNSKLYPEQNVLAVHLTNYFPDKGFVRASAANLGRFLVTLHFTLGQSVVDHSKGNWSKRRYAVILPLAAMKDQILNLMPQDTFVLGDVKLPPSAVVFAPKGEIVPQPISHNVEFYDESYGLKLAVDDYIRRSGTLQIKARTSWEESLIVEGKNLNDINGTKAFFSDLLTQKPYITNQNHASSPWGVVDEYIIYTVGFWLRTGTPVNSVSSSDLVYKLLGLQDATSEAIRISKNLILPEHAKQSLREGIEALSKYTSLVKLELEIRKAFKRTIVGTDISLNPVLFQAILKALGSKDKLRKIVEENIEQFSIRADDYTDISPEVLGSNIRYSDLNGFAKIMRQEFPRPSQRETQEMNAASIKHAVQLLSEGRITVERALQEWMARIERSDPMDGKLNPFIQDIVGKPVDSISPAMITFFSSPVVKDHLKNLYDAWRREFRNEPENLSRFEQVFGK